MIHRHPPMASRPYGRRFLPSKGMRYSDWMRDQRQDRLAIGLLLAFAFLVVSMVGYMLFISKVTVTEVKGVIYAYDVRTVPGKVKKPNIVFINVELPTKVVTLNTGQHTSKCPFIDTKTPVVVEVRTTSNRITGEFMHATHDLKYHPCKMENK